MNETFRVGNVVIPLPKLLIVSSGARRWLVPDKSYVITEVSLTNILWFKVENVDYLWACSLDYWMLVSKPKHFALDGIDV